MGPDRVAEAGVWPAPAKINRFLHIVGRRPDGYHLLQTLFQFLDLADEVRVAPREDARIERRGDRVDADPERDLCVRAARALNGHCGRALGATITVTKRIPAGGGLGGGSSDAATTLVALNAVWGLGLGEDELAAIGLGLGADVPIFVRGRAAWAEGVGEALTPVDLDRPWYVILDPACPVSTAAVFSHPKLTRDSAPITIRGFRDGGVRNDCEAVVRDLYPAVAEALDWLGARGEARLTGTGGCLFAPFDSRAAAAAVAAAVPAPWRALVAQGLNESPLRRRWV